jgi:hypothetical protein
MQAGAGLTAARIGRVLHASAAAFAFGALAALYIRGIAFEYRAGWESTFLAAPAVHALLNAVLGPASALTGIALPDVDGIARLRFSAGSGEIAAPWLHLYAVTVGLIVVLPRTLLALGDRWLEARLASRFPLPLDEPYYRALLRTLREEPVVARIVPYSAQLSPQATLNLNSLFTHSLGAKTTVGVAPATSFGAEDDIDPRQLVNNATLVVALFAMTATPEAENHGAFIDRLRAAAPAHGLLALLDESVFRRQFGATPRLDERRALWRGFAAEHGVPVVFVDLEQPDTTAARQSLQAALEAPVPR